MTPQQKLDLVSFCEAAHSTGLDSDPNRLTEAGLFSACPAWAGSGNSNVCHF